MKTFILLLLGFVTMISDYLITILAIAAIFTGIVVFAEKILGFLHYTGFSNILHISVMTPIYLLIGSFIALLINYFVAIIGFSILKKTRKNKRHWGCL